MQEWDRSVRPMLLALALGCTGWLFFNMVAIPVFRQDVFVDRGRISMGGETLILVGFLLTLIFDLATTLWFMSSIRGVRDARRGDRWLGALGATCVILLLGDKVMVDEISHEYDGQWRLTGEWVVLYALLTIQLFYNLGIVRRVWPVGHMAPGKIGA